jgi:predicted amidohydrolase
MFTNIAHLRMPEQPSPTRAIADPQESDTLSPGSHLTTFTAPFGTIGLGICYDIVRLPSLLQSLSSHR